MTTWKERPYGAGFGLAAMVALVATGLFVPNATAADFGEDVYRTDDGESHYQRKSRGSAHTFDVEPYRHPQVAKRPQYNHKKSYKDDYVDRDRYANRDDRFYDDGEGYAEAPYQGSLKDERFENDFAEHRGHRRYAEDRWRSSEACLPKRQLRRQLRRQGWRGFRRGRVRGNIGYVEARKRGSGEVYELAVDRCTGEVISAACIRDSNRGFRGRDFREDVAIHW